MSYGLNLLTFDTVTTVPKVNGIPGNSYNTYFERKEYWKPTYHTSCMILWYNTFH